MENIKELIQSVNVVAREKNISENQVIDAICDGIATSLRKNFPEGSQLHVELDETMGTFRGWRMFNLVEQVSNPEAEMLFNEVDENDLVENNYVWEEFPVEIGRQQFNIIKQVTLQKIKSEEKKQQIDLLLERPIKLYQGVVKVARKDSLLVDTFNTEILIPRQHIFPQDTYKIGDKITFTLLLDRNHYIGTKNTNEYLIEVFKKEIVAIEEGDVEIVKIARIPGVRSKVLVRSKKANIDPIRVCVGNRGMHIKNINSFLNGEIVDIVKYDDNIAQLAINALAPINISSILIDEDKKHIDISVADSDIALAIGKSGKNISLVSQLLGWTVHIYSATQWQEKTEKEQHLLIKLFMKALNCDEELAQILIDNGFLTIEEIAYVATSEFEQTGLDEDIINDIQQNAKETLEQTNLMKTINSDYLLGKMGFSEEEISTLQDNQIYNNYDISQLSTYDLQDILPNIDINFAKDIIIKSRQEEKL